jgi:hypothetical protein
VCVVRVRLAPAEIQSFFAESIAELQSREPSVTGSVEEIAKFHFQASLYRNGKLMAQCEIWMKRERHSDGIFYGRDMHGGGGFNESLHVESDDQELQLAGLGMLHLQRSVPRKLNALAAADLLWADFIAPLQRR